MPSPPDPFDYPQDRSLTTHQGQRSQDRRDDPLGLSVLYAPPERSVDIVFIHGLGGASLRTWCRDRDLDYLWPQLWLPRDLPSARILTFGYNAHFLSKKERTSLTISDFANDLLFRMKHGESGSTRLGQVPIIVVAHSMGGLVFKKAFVQGHMNDEYRSVVATIKAVLFLATPHRGTVLADTLNLILRSSFFGHSSKKYVSELTRGSPTIDELNETFRHHAPKLQMFSFYETLATPIGPMSALLLDKACSVMGYPNETSQPLIANHHNVCKFTGEGDPNYSSVLGALRSVIMSVTSSETDSHAKDLQDIKTLLGVSGPLEEDIDAFRAVRKPGTCEKFYACREMKDWLASKSPHVLWAHAPPGNGKSTLCSFIVDRLQEENEYCAYFFIKYGHRKKQSTACMLRSLAYQMALQIPTFRQALTDLARSGVQIHNADTLTVWKKLYLAALSTVYCEKRISWVLDGLDESDSSKQVIELISAVGSFNSYIRVLVLSRPLSTIIQAFQMVKKKIPVIDIPLPDNMDDIRMVVAGEVGYLPASDEFKAKVIDEITSRSQRNFLWANLVLSRVANCHRQEQIKQVLETTPDGMDKLYDRMLDAVSDLHTKEDKALSKIILSWAMYAKTPLSVTELSEAYPAELHSIIDLDHTVSQICGQFVDIAQDKVTLVHHSAREYLRKTKRAPFSLDLRTVNEELFGKCMATLCDQRLRRKLSTLKLPKFLPYAAMSWAFHLESSSPESDRGLDALVRFFSGPFPLAWIQYFSISGCLSELFNISRIVTNYVRKRRNANADKSPMLHCLSDLSLIETWAIDLLKIPAKFGRHLSEDPSLIYKCIPPISPHSSAIHQKFAVNAAITLSVSGLKNLEWNDCLARVSANASRAVRLAVSARYLAVASDVPKGTITLWDTILFREYTAFFVNEHIWAICFNGTGSFFSCYGINHTFVWKVEDGSLLLTKDNPSHERAIDFKFDENDVLMMISDLRRVYKLTIEAEGEEQCSWIQMDPQLLEETSLPEHMFLGSPSSVAFNNDCTQVAVAYRSFPLTVWNIDPPEIVARLKRKSKQGQGSVYSYTGDNKVVWHPSGTHVMGIFGQIFKWSPIEDAYEEVKGETGVVPYGIQCSPNGHVFVTSDVEGSIKVYDFASLSLIYKLNSEDRINQICFDPNSVRFYDLRGSYCNVWEPNCLLRLMEDTAERIGDADSAADSFWLDTEDTHRTSISLPVSESHADSKSAITAIAAGARSQELLAYSTDAGEVDVYDPITEKRHRVAKSLFGMPVEHLIWTVKHDHLAYSFSNGTTTIKSISITAGPQREVVATDISGKDRSSTDRGRTRQLLFDESGESLLIYGAKKSQVLSIPSGQIIAERDMPDSESAKWKQHPSQPDILLCFTSDAVTTFTWQLERKESTPLKLPTNDLSISPTVDALLSSHCMRYILVRTMTKQLNRLHYGFFVLPASPIFEGGREAISPLHLSPTISGDVVGIIPDGRLVFLDQNLWVCTAQLNGDDSTVARHFFLPRDWVTSSGVKLCQVLQDGTFLCPSKGEVAIMKSDPISNW
ncbi:hypothetical protein N7520_005852 [Penicillium odoratum]|uniref:uncharacterized protein n=1 Tax=Penicillium odoratum TaxID=1167516 RepID=UPI002549403D|nr:uncharacterized protein N7520_005852 [Penicillium odoratum]KAJ5758696.1 hypothetical protein N7520_005852 [Penicillium odoratum]